MAEAQNLRYPVIPKNAWWALPQEVETKPSFNGYTKINCSGA